ncbi:MAG: CHAP domain-containing protein [Gammaproteobacteria bacterium]
MIIVKLLRIRFIICLSVLAFAIHAEELPLFCVQDCVVEYGETLGEPDSGVKAFSNCNNSCVNPTPYFINETFTGIQWQCVEYARRWLLVNTGVVYGDVDVAADIWQLENVTSADKKSQKPFISILNGDQQHGLQRGDLLIYSRAFYGTGHVAVVLKVDEKKQRLYLGEQNFDNGLWQQGYARDVPYVKHEDGIWVLDPYLIGWKRVINE